MVPQEPLSRGIAMAGSHVSVGQLIPGLRKGGLQTASGFS